MLCYCDSSVVVKRYIAETGSSFVTGLTDPSIGNTIYIAGITRVEVVSAIVRRERRGEIAPTAAAQALAEFRAELHSIYSDVEVSLPLMEIAMVLVERHGLRAYDAVQLAVALQTQAQCLRLGYTGLLFLSADTALNTAAVAEGLPVDDPNAHP